MNNKDIYLKILELPDDISLRDLKLQFINKFSIMKNLSYSNFKLYYLTSAYLILLEEKLIKDDLDDNESNIFIEYFTNIKYDLIVSLKELKNDKYPSETPDNINEKLIDYIDLVIKKESLKKNSIKKILK